jgi:acetylornithine deacetylase
LSTGIPVSVSKSAEHQGDFTVSVSLLRELVRVPSVVGSEGAVQMLVADLMRHAGLEVEVWDLDADELARMPGAARYTMPYEGRPNVVGVRRGTGGGRSLILNGHVDVVPTGPLSEWAHDPWAAEVVDGKLYGRGALDMKAGLAIMLWVAQELRGLDLAGDLILQAVVEEEATGNGTLAACARGYRADAALLLEPTDLTATVAHLGVLWFRVTVHGRAAHAAGGGASAIDKAIGVVGALRSLEATLNRTVHPLYRGVAHPINLNVGQIRGGSWPSSLAAECVLDCRLALYPGQPVEELKAAVVDAVTRFAAADPLLCDRPPEVSFSGLANVGSAVEPDAPIVSALGAAHERVTGHPLKLVAETGGNDMRSFIVHHGIPAICYGPAGAGAHAADEHVRLDSLNLAARTVKALVLDWCGGTAP